MVSITWKDSCSCDLEKSLKWLKNVPFEAVCHPDHTVAASKTSNASVTALCELICCHLIFSELGVMACPSAADFLELIYSKMSGVENSKDLLFEFHAGQHLIAPLNELQVDRAACCGQVFYSC